MINFENLDKFAFTGVGKYDIPQIEPVKAYPQGEFVPGNYLLSAFFRQRTQKIKSCISLLTIINL